MTHAVVSRTPRCRTLCQRLTFHTDMAAFPFGPQFWRARPKLSRAALLSGLFLASFAIGIAWSAWSLVCREGACPDPTRLDAFQPRQTSKLFAADGRFLAELGLERRTLDQARRHSEAGAAGLHHHRGQALLRPRRHRLDARRRRLRGRFRPPQFRPGLLHAHDAARAKHLSRSRSRAKRRSRESSRKPRSRGRSRRDIRRRRSSSSTSIRSISAMARTASRPRPSTTSANRFATSIWPRRRRSPRSRRGPSATTRASIPIAPSSDATRSSA